MNGRIVQLERQVDELQRLNFALRDKLLELARNCGYCRGVGTVYAQKEGPPLPCPVCTHIRKALEL